MVSDRARRVQPKVRIVRIVTRGMESECEKGRCDSHTAQTMTDSLLA